MRMSSSMTASPPASPRRWMAVCLSFASGWLRAISRRMGTACLPPCAPSSETADSFMRRLAVELGLNPSATKPSARSGVASQRRRQAASRRVVGLRPFGGEAERAFGVRFEEALQGDELEFLVLAAERVVDD